MAMAAVQFAPAPPLSNPIQRPLKGSRISSFYPVKELPPLSALDSAFQLQEYISLLIRKDVHDVDAIVSLPGKGKEREGSEGEEGGRENGADAQKDGGAEGKSEVVVDESCWIYEQLRRLAQDLSHPLITMLQQECTRQTCPEMKAGEWLYLCVAHGTEGAMEQCCAIDYILHTLDSATALLNSPRAFPSRLSIPVSSNRHFSSLARRLGRIFAHAYFHHRAAFAQAEAESALYARFLALTSRFDLVPAEFLVIPPGIVGYGQDDHDREIDEYPRLLGASIDPRRERENVREDDPSAARGGLIHLDADLQTLTGSASERRDPSPRKIGRNRTDTMVHSEVASVVEELGRATAMGEGDELSQEREPASERERVPTIRPEDIAKKAEETAEEKDKPVPEPENLTESSVEPTQESDAPVEMIELAVPQSEELEPEVALTDVAELAPDTAVSSEILSKPAHAEADTAGASATAPTEVDITLESPADPDAAMERVSNALEVEEPASASTEIEHDVSEIVEVAAEETMTVEEDRQESVQEDVVQDAVPNHTAENIEELCVNVEPVIFAEAPHVEAEPAPVPEEAQEHDVVTHDDEVDTEEYVTEPTPALEEPTEVVEGEAKVDEEEEEEKSSIEAIPALDAEVEGDV
ncbi:uncharacterized protein FIBRA_02824 [Fibroporia radiculosa]|uniref:Mob1/phocein n=1 Tax=Fibroporia radiculosa TaxID=599839 RepID=J4HVJ7_9APHY|nr:uncharacterized protein FIBRA_02824 [Fibroporia radiculosa]CCM00782.1 predicted protein [Fibroporia radiculosa]